MRTSQFFKSLFIGSLLITSVVLAEKGWFDRILPRKANPQVLSDTHQKPLVEPHPDVVNLQNSFAQVAEVVKPATVNISAVHIERIQTIDPNEFFFGDPNEFFYRFFGEEAPQRRPRRPREYRSEGTGSGVIIDPEGYILTNNHVVQGADELTVTLSDGKSLKGSVVGTDPRTDLAVIRIKDSGKFPFAPLGDSAQVRVGDWVLAIGSPFGLEQTVTAGIISAIRQSLVIEGKTFSNLFQTDAAINRGNSGGPLVNIRGEVVGINSAIYAPTGVFSGIGFAIPVNNAKEILKDLIQKGYVERSWVGVEIAPIDQIMAQQFGLKQAEGAVVNDVMEKSPASKAGLKRGDVIVEINGKKVKNAVEIQETVGRTPPNSEISIKVIRDGSPRVIKVKTELMPSPQGEIKPKSKEKPSLEKGFANWLGAEFQNLDPINRQKYSLRVEDMQGVVAVDVPPDSDAAEAGLMEGDVIRSINRIPTPNIGALKGAMSKVDFKKGVVFDLVRDGRSFFLSFKPLQ